MSNKTFITVVTTAGLLFTVPVAQAHSLSLEDPSWLAGFMHPLSGLDHVLVALAIGLWATQQGESRLWQLPMAFSSTMVVGALAGYSSVAALSGIETGIVTSLWMLGLILALSVSLSKCTGFLMASVVGLMHGYVHAGGLVETMQVMPYTLGFLLATMILLGVGLVFGLWLRAMRYDQLLRIAGFTIGMTGGWLCV